MNCAFTVSGVVYSQPPVRKLNVKLPSKKVSKVASLPATNAPPFSERAVPLNT